MSLPSAFFQRPFLFLLYTLDPKWKTLDPTDPDDRAGRNGLLALAGYYFLQLASFRLSGEIAGYFKSLALESGRPTYEFNGQCAQILGTLAGALLGWWLLWWRRRVHWQRFDSLRLTLNVSSLVLIAGVLLSALWFKGLLQAEWVYYLAKISFGIGWACGIGVAIIWCSEYLPPYLRTSGAIFIGSMGFLGAAVVAGVMVWPAAGQEATLHILLIVSIAVSIGMLLLWKRLPEDSRLNQSYDPEHKSTPDPQKSFWGRAKTRHYVRVVLCSLLIGTSVQYFTFLVRNFNKITCHHFGTVIQPDPNHQDQAMASALQKDCGCRYDAAGVKATIPLSFQTLSAPARLVKGSDSWFQFLRYFGMFAAGFFLFRYSWKKNLGRRPNPFFRKRIRLLAAMLLVQLVFMGLVIAVWQVDFPVFHTLWMGSLISLGTGIFGSTWVLCGLAVAEQFSMTDRPLWVLLAPNAYRMADLILLLRTEDVMLYVGDKSFGLLLWGLIFTFVGFLSALGMDDDFEGDPLYLPKNAPLSNSDIRKAIRKIQAACKGERDFLQQTNAVLARHFQEALQEQFYCSSIYQITGDIPRIFDIINNPRAFTIYRRPGSLPDDTGTIPGDPHPVSFDLIKNKLHRSFAYEVIRQRDTQEKEVRGGLLWCSGRSYPLDHYKKEKYQVVDLFDLTVPDIKRQIHYLHHLRLRDENDRREMRQHYARGIGYQLAPKPFNTDVEAFRNQPELMQLLAFFRVDAGQHVFGRYFLHIIKPYTDRCELALMIKTTVPLSSTRLEELRALITFIELGLKNKTLDERVAELSREEEHNRKGEMGWLQKQVDNLISLEAQSDPALFKEIHTSIQNVIGHLYAMTAFNAALLRFELQEELPNDIRTTQLDLTGLMKDVWKKVGEASPFLRISERQHREGFIRFVQAGSPLAHLPALRLQHVYELPLRVIWFELFKNAAQQSSSTQPFIHTRIRFLEPGEGCAICLENSVDKETTIDLEPFELTAPDYRGKAGIRTVKRYLRFFNAHLKQHWNIQATCSATTFTLTLLIPEECLIRN